jgi:hypothetical protein
MKPGTCRSGGTTSRSLRRGNSPRRSRLKPDSRSISADTLGSSVRSTPQNHRRSSSRCKNWSACSSFRKARSSGIRCDDCSSSAYQPPSGFGPPSEDPCGPTKRIRNSACYENCRSRLRIHDLRPNLLAETTSEIETTTVAETASGMRPSWRRGPRLQTDKIVAQAEAVWQGSRKTVLSVFICYS